MYVWPGFVLVKFAYSIYILLADFFLEQKERKRFCYFLSIGPKTFWLLDLCGNKYASLYFFLNIYSASSLLVLGFACWFINSWPIFSAGFLTVSWVGCVFVFVRAGSWWKLDRGTADGEVFLGWVMRLDVLGWLELFSEILWHGGGRCLFSLLFVIIVIMFFGFCRENVLPQVFCGG